MSYSFDRTMNALGVGPNDDSSNNQSNVLAPQSGSQGSSGGQQPGQSSDTITTSSTAGDLGTAGAGGSGGSGNRSPDSPSVSNTTANNSLLSKNAGRVAAPVDVQGLQNSIGGARQGLQNEANSYVTGAGDMFGGGRVNDAYQGQINQFVQTGRSPMMSSNGEPIPQGSSPSGYDAYQAQSQGQFGGTQPYDFTALYGMGKTQVDPLDIKTNTSFNKANQLGTDAGLQQLFRQGNDAEYNKGSAALDTALLTRTPGFNQQRDAITQANQDLGNYRNEVIQNAPGYAQQTRDSAQQAWKQAVNDQLSSGLTGIQSSGQSAADAFIKQLGLGAPSGFAQQQATSGGFRGAYNPTTGRVESASGVDPNQFVKPAIDPSTVKWDQFLNADQANAYNAINALQGNGGAVLSGPGKYASGAPSNGVTFDSAGYRAAAADAAMQRVKDQQAAAAAQQAAQVKAEQNSPFAVGGYTDNGEGNLPTDDPAKADYGGPLMFDPFDTNRIRKQIYDRAGDAFKDARFY